MYWKDLFWLSRFWKNRHSEEGRTRSTCPLRDELHSIISFITATSPEIPSRIWGVKPSPLRHSCQSGVLGPLPLETHNPAVQKTAFGFFSGQNVCALQGRPKGPHPQTPARKERQADPGQIPSVK